MAHPGQVARVECQRGERAAGRRHAAGAVHCPTAAVELHDGQPARRRWLLGVLIAERQRGHIVRPKGQADPAAGCALAEAWRSQVGPLPGGCRVVHHACARTPGGIDQCQVRLPGTVHGEGDGSQACGDRQQTIGLPHPHPIKAVPAADFRLIVGPAVSEEESVGGLVHSQLDLDHVAGAAQLARPHQAPAGCACNRLAGRRRAAAGERAQVRLESATATNSKVAGRKAG